MSKPTSGQQHTKGSQRDQTPRNLTASAEGETPDGRVSPIHIHPVMKTNHLFAFATLLVGMTLTACSPDSVAQPGGAKPAMSSSTTLPDAVPKTHMLAVVGYNYTDRYIDSFSVAGQGGGNIGVSWPGSSGQGSMCCVTWTDGSTLPRTLKVLWVGAYCMQRRTNSDGETSDTREPLWKTTDAVLTGPVPVNPKNLEVHFFRDDHVEVAITDKDSPVSAVNQFDGLMITFCDGR